MNNTHSLIVHTPVLFYSILFYSILFYSIPVHSKCCLLFITLILWPSRLQLEKALVQLSIISHWTITWSKVWDRRITLDFEYRYLIYGMTQLLTGCVTLDVPINLCVSLIICKIQIIYQLQKIFWGSSKIKYVNAKEIYVDVQNSPDQTQTFLVPLREKAEWCIL